MGFAIGIGISPTLGQGGGVLPPLLLEDFESMAAFTFGGTAGGANALDTVNFNTGAKGLQLTANNSAAASWFGTETISWDLSAGGVIAIWVNVPDPARAAVTLYFSSANFAGSKFISKQFGFAGIAVPGKQFFMCDLSEFGASGSESIANLMTQFRVRIDSSTGGTFTVDSLYFFPTPRKRKAAVALTFDDGFDTQYSVAYPYMASKSMLGTAFIVQDFVATAGYMALADIQALYAAGWDVSNHTKAHLAFNSHTTTGVATSQTPAASFTIDGSYASAGTATLDAPRNIVFTSAGNEQHKAFVVTGSLGGNGKSETVYGVNAGKFYTTGLFDVVTSITISAAAAGAITVGTSYTSTEVTTALSSVKTYLTTNSMTRGADFLAYPQGEFNPQSDAACVSLGVKLARMIRNNMMLTKIGVPNTLQVPSYALSFGTTTLAQAKAIIDLAILRGATIVMYAHKIVTTPSTSLEWATSDFQALIDYLVTKRDAGLIDVITFTQLYARIVALA